MLKLLTIDARDLTVDRVAVCRGRPNRRCGTRPCPCQLTTLSQSHQHFQCSTRCRPLPRQRLTRRRQRLVYSPVYHLQLPAARPLKEVDCLGNGEHPLRRMRRPNLAGDARVFLLIRGWRIMDRILQSLRKCCA